MTLEEHESIMRQWDSWRKHIAEGGKGSWPRDCFEALIDSLGESIDGQKSRALAAEAERDALKAEVGELRRGAALFVESQKATDAGNDVSAMVLFGAAAIIFRKATPQ